jgi:hypothetical protein
MMQLAAFLSAAASQGFAWGRHDCMLFAADWARALTGDDPAAAWRGSYDSQFGALAILTAEGGHIQIMAQGLKPHGWRRVATEDTEPGDIVLANPLPHQVAAGVAVARDCIALLTRRGLVVGPVPVIAAWRHG